MNILNKNTPQQVILTDIQIKIGELNIKPSEKSKLESIAEKAIEFAKDERLDLNFPYKVSLLYELFNWIKDKIK